MKPSPSRLVASIALCFLLASCAQTGPPLPPSLELPKPPIDLRASRKGNQVALIWSEPALTTDRQSVRYVGPTLICRSLETEITDCGSPAATMAAPSSGPLKSKSRRAASKKTGSARPTPQIYTDTLPASMQSQNQAAEVTYAVEVLNRNAHGAGLSNRVHVPAIVTMPPPSDFSAELTSDGVVLSWTSVGEIQQVAAQTPANATGPHVRYRIYRRDEGSGKDAIAGEVPLGGRGPVRFTDSGFEWEKTYLYRITAVSMITRPDSEVQIEGDDTPPVRIVAHDTFPPSVPTGLQAVYSGEGQKPFIDLIWAPVTSADLAGYNIYRNEGNRAAAVKLNSELVRSPSYRDSGVAAGRTYTYAVSAVDVRGNESRRSEDASESVPKVHHLQQ